MSHNLQPSAMMTAAERESDVDKVHAKMLKDRHVTLKKDAGEQMKGSKLEQITWPSSRKPASRKPSSRKPFNRKHYVHISDNLSPFLLTELVK